MVNKLQEFFMNYDRQTVLDSYFYKQTEKYYIEY